MSYLGFPSIPGPLDLRKNKAQEIKAVCFLDSAEELSYLSKYGLLDHSLDCSCSETGTSEGPSFVLASNRCGAFMRLH